jgi:hypothetical protein
MAACARIASHPALPWLSVSSSIVDTGIELSCSTRLLPMPMELKATLANPLTAVVWDTRWGIH